jgi:serine/threonine protein kinase
MDIPKFPTLAAGQSLVDRAGRLYEIESKIGYGGLGLVYKAISRDIGPVAIKFPRKIQHLGDLMMELRWISGMRIGHTVIPIDLGTKEFSFLPEIPIPFIVMPFYAFGSISDYIRTREKEMKLSPDDPDEFVPAVLIPIGMAARWVVQVGRALKRLSIVHRDIKPENIFLDDEYNANLGDFGLALPVSPALRQKAEIVIGPTMVGTISYMAPEHFSANPEIDHRADIYSLGLMLFELVTGNDARQRYFEKLGKEKLKEDKKAAVMFKLLQQEDFFIPLDHIGDRTLRRIIERCTRPAMKDRYQTYDDLLGDLAAIADMPSRLSEERRIAFMQQVYGGGR